MSPLRDVADGARGIAVYARARIGRGTSAQGFYAQHLRFRDLVFDVGAFKGWHTAAMLKRGARVVALEPQADLAQRLMLDYPAARVLQLGASDSTRSDTLMTVSVDGSLASLNPSSLDNPSLAGYHWDGQQSVSLTTLDELIAEFGRPAFAKLDTEGHEDRVLAGLSQPIEQFLIEVRSGLHGVATRMFDRLAELGAYEYRIMERESWVFSDPTPAEAILAKLPVWGDVYAYRLHS